MPAHQLLPEIQLGFPSNSSSSCSRTSCTRYNAFPCNSILILHRTGTCTRYTSRFPPSPTLARYIRVYLQSAFPSNSSNSKASSPSCGRTSSPARYNSSFPPIRNSGSGTSSCQRDTSPNFNSYYWRTGTLFTSYSSSSCWRTSSCRGYNLGSIQFALQIHFSFIMLAHQLQLDSFPPIRISFQFEWFMLRTGIC